MPDVFSPDGLRKSWLDNCLEIPVSKKSPPVPKGPFDK